MASSDDWIKSFDSMTIIPSPSSSQSQPSPGGSSLSGGTISGEYGGGAKRATLFYYVDSLAPLCLGFVGLDVNVSVSSRGPMVLPVVAWQNIQSSSPHLQGPTTYGGWILQPSVSLV
jgi:hypothetical protein